MSPKKVTVMIRIEQENGAMLCMEFDMDPASCTHKVERDTRINTSPDGAKSLGPDDTFHLTLDGSFRRYRTSTETDVPTIAEWLGKA